MPRSKIALFTAAMVLAATASVQAQFGSRFFLEDDYARLGLEQAWSAHVQFDSARGQAQSLVLQVVGIDSYDQLQQHVYRIYEVHYQDRVVRFSERDVDASGRVLGRAEAERLAEKEMILLKARGFDPELSSHDVPPTVIYVQSNTGTLEAIDAETGQSLWTVMVGNPRYPMSRPASNDRFVASVNGSTLYLMDRATGEPIWDRPLDMNPAPRLRMSDRFVFVPGLGGQLQAYPLPTTESDHAGTPPWTYLAGARISGGPSIAGSTITWSTAEGQLLVASLDGPTMLYRRHTNGPVESPTAFVAPDRLIVATRDGYVTALDQQTGSPQWYFSAGVQLVQKPIASPQHVYVASLDHQLFCIDSDEGMELWVAQGIDQVVAVGKDRLYVLGPRRELIALDRQNGTRLATLPMSQYHYAYGNSLTDRLYLMTTDGTLLCLREQGAEVPTIWRPLPEAAEEPTTAESRAEPVNPDADVQPFEPVDGGIFGDDMFPSDEASDLESPPAGDEPATDDADEDFDDPFDFG